MQWRMLGRRGRLASWTVVGDPAQTRLDRRPGRARPGPATGRWARAAGTTYTLTTNYRNSAEIFAVAAAVIREIAARPGAADGRAHDRGRAGGPCRCRPAELAAAVAAAAATLLGEVEGTVGVITPVPRRDEVAGWLGAARRAAPAGGDRLAGQGHGVRRRRAGRARRDPCRRPRSGVRTLYVALSRATQRLVTVGRISPARPAHPPCSVGSYAVTRLGGRVVNRALGR